MARGFVLLDVVPGREESVFQQLGRVPAIIARRKLASHTKFYDVIVLVEGETDADVERATVTQVRSIPGVKGIQPIGIEFTMTGDLQKIMEEMEAEVKKRLEP